MDHLAPVPPPPSSEFEQPAPLPLRFALPNDWPVPSVDWLAANQGWDPPEGWTPTPGVPPAPAGHTWWVPDPVGWKAMTGHVTATFRRSIVVSSIIFVLGVALTIAPLTLHASFGFFFWGAIIFGPINIVRNITALRKSRASFLGLIRNRAAEVRQTLDTSTYSAYLAGAPNEPLPFDRFLAQRAQQAWSFTGQWPLDQNHRGVTDPFRIPNSTSGRSRTIGTIVFAGFAAVALVALVVSSIGGFTGTSGSTARGSNVGHTSTGQQASGTGSAPSKYDVDWSFVDDSSPTTASCPDDGGCWIVRLKADPSCTNAALMVDFYKSKKDTDPSRTKDFAVTLKNGTADVAIPSVNDAEKYADVFQAHWRAQRLTLSRAGRASRLPHRDPDLRR